MAFRDSLAAAQLVNDQNRANFAPIVGAIDYLTALQQDRAQREQELQQKLEAQRQLMALQESVNTSSATRSQQAAEALVALKQKIGMENDMRGRGIDPTDPQAQNQLLQSYAADRLAQQTQQTAQLDASRAAAEKARSEGLRAAAQAAPGYDFSQAQARSIAAEATDLGVNISGMPLADAAAAVAARKEQIASGMRSRAGALQSEISNLTQQAEGGIQQSAINNAALSAYGSLSEPQKALIREKAGVAAGMTPEQQNSLISSFIQNNSDKAVTNNAIDWFSDTSDIPSKQMVMEMNPADVEKRIKATQAQIAARQKVLDALQASAEKWGVSLYGEDAPVGAPSAQAPQTDTTASQGIDPAAREAVVSGVATAASQGGDALNNVIRSAAQSFADGVKSGKTHPEAVSDLLSAFVEGKDRAASGTAAPQPQATAPSADDQTPVGAKPEALQKASPPPDSEQGLMPGESARDYLSGRQSRANEDKDYQSRRAYYDKEAKETRAADVKWVSENLPHANSPLFINRGMRAATRTQAAAMEKATNATSPKTILENPALAADSASASLAFGLTKKQLSGEAYKNVLSEFSSLAKDYKGDRSGLLEVAKRYASALAVYEGKSGMLPAGTSVLDRANTIASAMEGMWIGQSDNQGE